jgi:hypothetical protein
MPADARDDFNFDARDPDWDDVPPDLAANDGRGIRIVTSDGRVLDGMLHIRPGLFGDARRARGDAA